MGVTHGQLLAEFVGASERYDYRYTEDELREWVLKIEKMAAKSEKLFAFANNHYQGQSVTTAQQLALLLQGAGLKVQS